MLPDLKELRMRRKALKMSQQQLASDVGISQSLLTKVESGKVIPNYNIAKRLFERIEELEHFNEKTAAQFMNRKVVALKSTDTVRRMASIAKRAGISQFPVYDEGSIIGSLTTKDVMNADKDAEVGSIVKSPFPVISENAPMSAVKELLSPNSVHL